MAERKGSRETDFGLPNGYVTVKLVYVTTRKFKGIKLVNNCRLGKEVKFKPGIQINNMFLRWEETQNKVPK